MSEKTMVVASRGALVVCVLFAGVIRCFSFQNFFRTDGGFLFYSIDSYDHLRRITLGIHSFPHLANFDYYAAYPQGLGQIWSPGFDYILSAICTLFGGGRITTETICFFFNPFAACCVVLLVFFVARDVFQSEAAAIGAALVYALHPAYLAYSLPMNFDHHAIEPLLVLLIFAFPLFEREGMLSWHASLLLSAILILAIILWRGSTIYWFFGFLSALVRGYVAGNRKTSISYARVFAMAALGLASYCVVDPWYEARQFSFAVISWFHVLILFGASIVLGLLGICRTRRRFWGWLITCGGVVLMAILLSGQAEPIFKQILGGTSFLRGQGDPWLDSNSELRGVFRSRYSFWYSATYLTFFWFLAPFSVAVAFRQWRRNGQRNSILLNYCLWSPLWALGFILRYSHIAGVFASLAAGHFAACCYSEEFRQHRLRAAFVPAFMVLLACGVQHYDEAVAAVLPDYVANGLYGSDGVIPWLRDRTPVTSYWLDPIRKPEYGVLARWSLGARLYQDAHRPSLSTAFGWEAHGFYEEAAFWVTANESAAVKLLENNRIRYVVAQAVHDLPTDYKVARKAERLGVLPQNTIEAEFRPEWAMHSRLMNADGSMLKLPGGEMLPALETFRLVHETSFVYSWQDGTPSGTSYYKIFEHVPGATIIGDTDSANVQVVLMLDLVTSRGRKFSYLSRVVSGRDGSFSFRVPYATATAQGDVKALGDYTVFVGRRTAGTVKIAADDVAEGRVVPVQ